MAKLILILVAALTLKAVSAVTEDEVNSLRETALPIFKSCAEEYVNATDSTSSSAKNGNIPVFDSCFYACFFKKIAVVAVHGHSTQKAGDVTSLNSDADSLTEINDAGLFDPDVFLEKNKKHIKGEEDLEKVADIGKTCSSVNKQTVSDGTKGCDRSRLLLSCLIKENDNFLPFSPPASTSV